MYANNKTSKLLHNLIVVIPLLKTCLSLSDTLKGKNDRTNGGAQALACSSSRRAQQCVSSPQPRRSVPALHTVSFGNCCSVLIVQNSDRNSQELTLCTAHCVSRSQNATKPCTSTHKKKHYRATRRTHVAQSSHRAPATVARLLLQRAVRPSQLCAVSEALNTTTQRIVVLVYYLDFQVRMCQWCCSGQSQDYSLSATTTQYTYILTTQCTGGQSEASPVYMPSVLCYNFTAFSQPFCLDIFPE